MTTYRLINWWCRVQIVTTEMCFNVCFIFIVSHVFLCFSYSKCVKRAEFGHPESDLTYNSWAESQIRASAHTCKQKSRGTKANIQKTTSPKAKAKAPVTTRRSGKVTGKHISSYSAERLKRLGATLISQSNWRVERTYCRQENRHART